MKKYLVTGAGGFIGKHMVLTLQSMGKEVLPYHHTQSDELLESLCRQCSIVFHLAGVNRPKQETEYDVGNAGFTQKVITMLEKADNPCPVIYASSVQAKENNPYGESKRKAEELLSAYAQRTGAPVKIYRLPNVFGKWCRPNYNSAVATFCYNQSRGIPLTVKEPMRQMELVHIDDVVNDFLYVSADNPSKPGNYVEPRMIYRRRLADIADLIRSFDDLGKSFQLPNLKDDFTRKLYSTYVSYLPEDSLSFPLVMHKDSRGSFTEFLRTSGQGQFSVNVSRPHIVKGNHWHHTKHEKFLVVSGEGVVRLRKVGEQRVEEYRISGNCLQVIDIPPGYTHNIENLGDTDMVTLMWANENFSQESPDTWPLEV